MRKTQAFDRDSGNLKWGLNSIKSALYPEFHHHWCNCLNVPKKCVNETLQRTANVLLSGPFRKVSQRPTERFLSSPQIAVFRGRSTAAMLLFGSSSTQGNAPYARRELLPKSKDEPALSRKLGDAGKE
jgi:hypothetical protein